MKQTFIYCDVFLFYLCTHLKYRVGRLHAIAKVGLAGECALQEQEQQKLPRFRIIYQELVTIQQENIRLIVKFKTSVFCVCVCVLKCDWCCEQNDEHAELVYKLRNLVDMANNISTSTSGTKLVKSSATLQIIQSRLAIKQQLYADALLRNQQVDNKTTATTTNDAASADQTHSANFGESSLTSAAKDNDEAGDNDDDDNESFVSADSVLLLILQC